MLSLSGKKPEDSEMNGAGFPPPRIATSPSGPEPPHHRGFTITLRHTTLGRTGRVISHTRRPPPSNTQHSQGTDMHVSSGI
jgi:hypothetical protein